MGNYTVGLYFLLTPVVVLAIVLFFIGRSSIDAYADTRQTRKRFLAAVAATAVVVAALGAVYVFVHAPPHEARSDIIGLAFVSFFSGLVGFTEIAQRYTDRPFRLLTVSPALIYVYINMAAGVGTFALVDEFDVFSATTKHAMLYKVMLASFGAVAFFRSSFFTARVGEADVDVGPATLLKGLLAVTDQLINRWQAADRAEQVAALMRKVDFDKAKNSLPSLCFGTVQYITSEQQAACGEAIKKLATDIDDPVQRSILLGIYLTQLVGPEVLSRAATAMGDSITWPQAPPKA
jgi:hypothetical protein